MAGQLEQAAALELCNTYLVGYRYHLPSSGCVQCQPGRVLRKAQLNLSQAYVIGKDYQH